MRHRDWKLCHVHIPNVIRPVFVHEHLELELVEIAVGQRYIGVVLAIILCAQLIHEKLYGCPINNCMRAIESTKHLPTALMKEHYSVGDFADVKFKGSRASELDCIHLSLSEYTRSAGHLL